MSQNDHAHRNTVLVGAATIACVGIGFAVHRYRISAPHQYLVRTGLGINTVKISKKGFQWPFQTASFIDVRPFQVNFKLSAMSNEKLEFLLPGNMTIGPKLDTINLQRYAELMSSQDNIETTVLGIIEGETRIIAAKMSMESVFGDRSKFKEEITQGVEEELQSFGLTVYNANIQELRDTPGSVYFEFLRQKATSGANNVARVDVAEAELKGAVGSKERETAQRQAVAKLELTARQAEILNEQEVERAKTELEQNKILFQRQNELARIEAKQALALREAQLRTEVEKMRYEEQKREGEASVVAAAEIQASSLIHESEGRAEAMRRQANADLYVAQQRAKGIETLLTAEAEGLSKMLASVGGNPSTLLYLRMIDRNTLQELAAENAKAVQNLDPKITIWNTGGGAGSSTGMEPLQKLFQFLPPVLTTIAEQTGMQVPFVGQQTGPKL